MASPVAPEAGSVSKVECLVKVRGGAEARISLYRHLAPLTVNALLRALPLYGRTSIQPAMVCIFTDLRVGVEKPRTKFAKGDVALLASGGLVCVFLGDAASERPLNPVGKVEAGIEVFERLRLGDSLQISQAEVAQ
ncbi:MAG: hypothetical protein HY247_01605 [archaeon]|nr:MAG: hypothetical protein HY247_01605 [archaeon]